MPRLCSYEHLFQDCCKREGPWNSPSAHFPVLGVNCCLFNCATRSLTSEIPFPAFSRLVTLHRGTGDRALRAVNWPYCLIKRKLHWEYPSPPHHHHAVAQPIHPPYAGCPDRTERPRVRRLVPRAKTPALLHPSVRKMPASCSGTKCSPCSE